MSTCGICPKEETSAPSVLSIYVKALRAQQTKHGNKVRVRFVFGLQKNDKGQILDPLLRIPINTCKCGKYMGPMNPCIFKAISGDVLHGYIQ